jgi:hypothetical protein
MLWTASIWLRIATVEGCCEHGNEPSGSIKCWEVLEKLHSWRRFYAVPITKKVNVLTASISQLIAAEYSAEYTHNYESALTRHDYYFPSGWPVWQGASWPHFNVCSLDCLLGYLADPQSRVPLIYNVNIELAIGSYPETSQLIHSKLTFKISCKYFLQSLPRD